MLCSESGQLWTVENAVGRGSAQLLLTNPKDECIPACSVYCGKNHVAPFLLDLPNSQVSEEPLCASGAGTGQ